MADSMTANFSAAPEGVDADTHIVVNNQPRVTSINTASSNYSLDAPNLSTRRYGEATLNGTVDSATTRTVPGGINWGAVVKGAAIVTAVVVAAVIVYPLAVSAATSALAWASSSPVLGPVIGAVQAAGTWALHGLAYGAHWLAGFASGAWGAIAPAAVVAGHAAPAALTGAQIAAGAHGIGAVAASGTLVAGAVAAAPTLGHLPLFDPSHTVTTHTMTAVPMADGGHQAQTDEASLGSLLASKTSAIHAASQHDAMHQAADLAQHSTHHLSGAEGHHNAQTAQNTQDNQYSPDDERRADARTRTTLSRAMQANQNWSERVGGKRNASISPRDASYAVQADTDRLNAALHDNGVA